MSDYSNVSDDEANEANEINVEKRHKFIVFCVDVTNKSKSACDGIKFLSSLLEPLLSCVHVKSQYGIFFIGGEDVPIKMVLDPMKKHTEEFKKFKEETADVKLGSSELPLGEALGVAIDFILENSKDKYKEKSVILLTDAIEPTLAPHDADINKWPCVYDFLVNGIKLIITPLSEANLVTSNLYSQIAAVIDDLEINDTNQMLVHHLSSSSISRPIHFYYDEYNYITLFNLRFFSKSRPIEKSENIKGQYKRRVKNLDTVNFSNEHKKYNYTIGSKKVFFSAEESSAVQNMAIPDGHAHRSLQLMYVLPDEPLFPLQTYKKGCFLTPNSNDPSSLELAKHFWEYCHTNNKILVCSVAYEKGRQAYLRPTMFQNEFGFIMQTMGNLDNFNDTHLNKYKSKSNPPPVIKTFMHKLIDVLQVDETSLMFFNPKSAHLDALTKAKQEGRPLDDVKFVDELSKKYHGVSDKVSSLDDEFLNLSMQYSVKNPPKKRAINAAGRSAKRAPK